MREIRTTSVNLAGLLFMHGLEPIGTMVHERTKAVLLRFEGNPKTQDVVNRFNAGRDRAAEILNGEITTNGHDQQ